MLKESDVINVHVKPKMLIKRNLIMYQNCLNLKKVLSVKTRERLMSIYISMSDSLYE